jgi:very-short-patch-repair endonuclease
MQEIDKHMYFGAKPPIFEKADLLRRKETQAEKMLWEELKGKQICNVRFRRQHPIELFIADFYCHAAKLIIELDGNVHIRQKEYDLGRTAELNRLDIEVIRFKNDEVITDVKNVVLDIITIVKTRLEKK